TKRSRCHSAFLGLARRSATAREPVGAERGGQVALSDKHVADLDMCDGEVALPPGIYGIGFGEALQNLQCLVIARKSARKVPLGFQYRRDHSMRNRQVALPFGVARGGVGKL